MWQLLKIHLTTLTNPPIWAKFPAIIDLQMGWQEKAMIGLGSNKNVHFYPKRCKRFRANISYHKVNRCLARYSPRATTTNQMSRQGGPKMNKMPFSGQIWTFLGKKILIFTGEIKSFVTHITEIVHIVFWSGIGQKVQKMAIFGPKWPKMQILDQIWPFLGQKS